ncbi:MAG: hypothetical protein KKB50_21225, partial [Planctomycetes bacterium]|nr:hypothetical protein [Planctomycetota bacterium]
MQTPRSIAYRAFAATVVLLLVTGVAWGKGPAVNVQVLENTPQRILLQYDLVDLQAQTVLIAGQEYTQFVLEGESPLKTAGAPELPNVCRSIIIPDDSAMNVNVLETEYYDLEGVAAVPSKGVLLRTVDPASVPYTFGEVYEQDAFYPGELAGLRAPYILRDHRGAVVDVNLVQANPVAQTVRVYTKVVLEVVAVGPGQVNVLERTALDSRLSLSFHQIYKHHFINYGSSLAYAPLDETGDMLIICHDAWLPNIQPLVDHKSGIGITTTAVGVSTIGNNSTAIKNYIQSVYNAGNLAFVLLVGDADQVDTMYASGGSSDPSYALLAGSDSYPDIMIGRFSAESAGDVDTQVLRTIEYEQMPATQEDWFKRGMGVASNQGPGDDGEYDNEHIDNIRVDLLGYGYTLVDQIYDPYGTASQVTNGLNAGRGVINYCGHGSTTSWGSTGFSNTHVNALVNDNMLPFIVSVACVNGQFDGYTCFAEAWLRATHGSEPTGAIGMYASSINQSWDPPMCAQDETADLLVAEAYFSFGALCFGGSCQMMDEYGSAGVSMYNTWHVFGDPSVRVYGTAAPPTGLRVTPASGLDSSGPNGGPFTPDSVEYTLENMEDYPLDYSVTKGAAWLTVANGNGTLPAYGTAIVTVSINSVANTLGNGTYEDTVAFVNTTNHDGDADRLVTLEVGAPTLQYSWNMDTNPVWTTQGLWAWGPPTGGGGQHGGPDPTSGYTGSNVYGYNLSGDYE